MLRVESGQCPNLARPMDADVLQDATAGPVVDGAQCLY